MKWASSISGLANLEGAMEECTSSILAEISESSSDLAIVFVSPHFAAEYAQVPALVRNKLRPKLLFGCSAGGVIGAGREIEQRPGLSITVAQLPDVELTSFHLDGDGLPDLDAPPERLGKEPGGLLPRPALLPPAPGPLQLPCAELPAGARLRL